MSVTQVITLLVVFASRVWLIILDVNKRRMDLMIVTNVRLIYVQRMIALGMNYVVKTYKGGKLWKMMQKFRKQNIIKQ
jgi:hypothetical protein